MLPLHAAQKQHILRRSLELGNTASRAVGVLTPCISTRRGFLRQVRPGVGVGGGGGGGGGAKGSRCCRCHRRPDKLRGSGAGTANQSL